MPGSSIYNHESQYSISKKIAGAGGMSITGKGDAHESQYSISKMSCPAGGGGMSITGKSDVVPNRGPRDRGPMPPLIPRQASGSHSGSSQYHSSVASTSKGSAAIHGRVDWSSK